MMAESPTSAQVGDVLVRLHSRHVKVEVKEPAMEIKRRPSAGPQEQLNAVIIVTKKEEDRGKNRGGPSEKQDQFGPPRLAAPQLPRHAPEPPSYDESEYLEERKKPFNIEFSLHGIPNISKIVPRPSKMKQLEKYILENRSTQRFVALWGFGGFGKTQMVAAFAKEHQDDFSAIFFINAENQDTLDQSLAFHLNRIWEKWTLGLGRPQKKPEKPESVRLALYEWLRIRQNSNWLLVFDSVDYLRSENLDIKKYYPDTDHGAIIVTTRRREYEEFGHGIEVDRMTEEEASELLQRSQREDIELQSNAREYTETLNELNPARRDLLNSLDGYPLALVSIGRAIRNTGISYEELLKSKEFREICDLPEDSLYDHGSRTTLQRTTRFALNGLLYSTSNDAAKRQKLANAARLLLVLSYLDPRDIWFELLERGLLDPQCPHWFKQVIGSQVAFLEVIDVLLSWSLIRNGGNNVFTMHNLVRETLQRFAEEEDPEVYLRIAISCVGYSNPGNLHSRVAEIKRRVLPHAESVFQHLKNEKGYGVTGFLFQSLPADQASLAESLLKGDKNYADDKYIGYYHPIAEMIWLYLWFGRQKHQHALSLAEKAQKLSTGEYEKAEFTFLLGLIYFREKMHGKAAPLANEAFDLFCRLYTSTSREALFARRLGAAVKSQEGLHDQAIQIGREVVNQSEQQFGLNSEEVMSSIVDLASSYLRAGRDTEGRELQKQYFLLMRSKVGHDHPETRDAAFDIGSKIDEAPGPSNERSWSERRIWEGFSFSLGADHKESLEQAGHAAWVYFNEKHLDESCDVRRQIIRIMTERGLGDDHGLALARNYKLLVDVLIEKKENVENAMKSAQIPNLPDDHIAAKGVDSNGVLKELEAEIEKCLSEASNILQQMDSQKELNILALQHNVGICCSYIGKYDEAVKLFERTLDSLRVLPDSSRENIDLTLTHLADAYYNSKKDADVDRVLKELCRDTSIDPEQLEGSMSSLKAKALTCMNYERQAIALPIYQCLHEELRKKGVDDLETLALDSDLGRCLYETDRDSEAEQIFSSILSRLEAVEGNPKEKELFHLATLLNLGFAQQAQDNAQVALDSFLQAQKGYENLGERGDAVRSQLYIGQQYIELGDMTAAEIAFESILEFHTKQPESIHIGFPAQAAVYLGFVARLRGHNEKAENRLQEAVKLALQAKRKDLVTQAKRHLVSSYVGQCKWDQAIEVYYENFSSKDEPIGYSKTKVEVALLWCALVLAVGASEAAERNCHVILEASNEAFGNDDWKTLSALRVFKAIRSIREDFVNLGSSKSKYRITSTVEGYTKFLNPNDLDVLDTKEQLEADGNSGAHLLAEECWQVLLYCGQSDRLFEHLPEFLRYDIQYNPPPKGKFWPRSWTFVPDGAKFTEDTEIPLWIAGAPVIIPVPWRYPVLAGVIPPDDPCEVIDPLTDLNPAVVDRIFETFDFAKGALVLLNGLLQIIVDNSCGKFDYAWALSHKPRRFGGLQVDYVETQLIPATMKSKLSKTLGIQPPLQDNLAHSLTINDRIGAMVIGGPITSYQSIGKIGLRIKSKQNGAEFVTISTHVISDAIDIASKEKRRFAPFYQKICSRDSTAEWSKSVEIYAQDRHTSKTGKVGTIVKVFDERPGNKPPVGYEYDLTLVAPAAAGIVEGVRCPLPGLGWLSEPDWKTLQGEKGSKIKFLAGDAHESDIIYNDVSGYCQVIGQALFFNGDRSWPTDAPRDNRAFETLSQVVARCVLFRVPPKVKDLRSHSGQTLYAEKASRTGLAPPGPAIVGFLSFFHEAQAPELPTGMNMHDDSFRVAMSRKRVSFCGAFPVPKDIRDHYEIVCVPPSEQGHSDSHSDVLGSSTRASTAGRNTPTQQTAVPAPTPGPERRLMNIPANEDHLDPLTSPAAHDSGVSTDSMIAAEPSTNSLQPVPA